MSFILKYAAICIAIIIVVGLIVTFAGGIFMTNDNIESNKAINKDAAKEQMIQDQNGKYETSGRQYLMHFNFNGSQSQVIEKIYGRAEFNLVYSGSQRFTANLLSRDGTILAVITDGPGPYNRIQAVNVAEAGPYLLDVKTSGEWSLSRR